MPAKIIIGADLIPTESNYNYFKGKRLISG